MKPHDLTERDQRELLEHIQAMGGLDAITEINHKSRKVQADEEWGKHAVAAYQAALKYPETGFIQKHDASIIKGLLSKMSNETLLTEWRSVHMFHGQPASSLRPVLASLMWQLIKQRGLQGAVLN